MNECNKYDSPNSKMPDTEKEITKYIAMSSKHASAVY
jgi:hypothetical protein